METLRKVWDALVLSIAIPFTLIVFLGFLAFGFLAAGFGGFVLAGIIDLFSSGNMSKWTYNGIILACGLGGIIYVFCYCYARFWPKDAGDVQGSARAATAKEIRALTVRSGLIIGRENTRKGKLLRYDGPGHLVTIAPTRSGKGVGAIIPNLLTARRSIVCIDPKGENARITRRQRGTFGKVHILDPFNITGEGGALYNPMGHLDAGSLDLAEDAATLAEAIVLDPPGQVQEAHWNEEAKALITGLIMFCACHEPDGRRTLSTVREHLTLGPEKFTELLAIMADSPEAGGLIARAANRQRGKNDREGASVLSTAQRHTHFLDSPRMQRIMAGSTFSFADLKKETVTIFLVLPPDRLDAYSRWLRLMLAQALQDMARETAVPPEPVLFLLDEFAALGRVEAVERAIGLMAGYHLQLWLILQDLHQLRGIYGAKGGTFLSNAGVTQAFNVNDYDTAKWLSSLLGQQTVYYETQSRPDTFMVEASDVRTSGHLTGRNLANPDEIMKLHPALMLVLLQAHAPVFALKPRYYDEPEFAGTFDPA